GCGMGPKNLGGVSPGSVLFAMYLHHARGFMPESHSPKNILYSLYGACCIVSESHRWGCGGAEGGILSGLKRATPSICASSFQVTGRNGSGHPFGHGSAVANLLTPTAPEFASITSLWSVNPQV